MSCPARHRKVARPGVERRFYTGCDRGELFLDSQSSGPIQATGERNSRKLEACCDKLSQCVDDCRMQLSKCLQRFRQCAAAGCRRADDLDCTSVAAALPEVVEEGICPSYQAEQNNRCMCEPLQ